MRYQGKIIQWNDKKGFGFVEPNGGGERAFVHVKAFTSRARRPEGGELIIYEQVTDSAGRYKAQNIQYVRDVRRSKKRSSNVKSNAKFGLGGWFTVVFCLGLCAGVLMGDVPIELLGAYVGMSVITYVVYAFDKSAAQNERWRTQESSLHLLALFAGWPGAWFAQHVLRHKSSKSSFQMVFKYTVVLNIALLILLSTDSGRQVLHSFLS